MSPQPTRCSHQSGTLLTVPAISGEAGFYKEALSGSEGSVLDPVVAIRYRITLDPHESVTINIVSGISETRDNALSLSKSCKANIVSLS